MSSFEDLDIPGDETTVPYSAVLEFAETVLNTAQLQEQEAPRANFVATHILHWLLEQGGRQSRDGTWEMLTNSEVERAALPPQLQQLVMKVWRNEPYFPDENTLQIHSTLQHIENEPVVPRYEDIQTFESFADKLAFARSQPDIMEGLHPGGVEVWPEIALVFRPDQWYSAKWGLEWRMSAYGTQVTPFGEVGHTRKATEFVIENHQKTGQLAELACRLALLAAARASYPPDEVAGADCALLIDRLYGRAHTPLPEIGKHEPRFELDPELSIKRLLVHYLLSGEEYR